MMLEQINNQLPPPAAVRQDGDRSLLFSDFLVLKEISISLWIRLLLKHLHLFCLKSRPDKGKSPRLSSPKITSLRVSLCLLTTFFVSPFNSDFNPAAQMSSPPCFAPRKTSVRDLFPFQQVGVGMESMFFTSPWRWRICRRRERRRKRDGTGRWRGRQQEITEK